MTLNKALSTAHTYARSQLTFCLIEYSLMFNGITFSTAPDIVREVEIVGAGESILHEGVADRDRDLVTGECHGSCDDIKYVIPDHLIAMEIHIELDGKRSLLNQL